MVFKRNEALRELSKEGFNESQANVVIDKYLLKNKDKELIEKSYFDLAVRVATDLARHTNKQEHYSNLMYKAIRDRIIVLGGSITSGIGSDRLQLLSNCFVIEGAKDDYGSIMEVDANQVNLMKRRGGVGHDLSGIRPKGMPVNNSALTSTGVVPFMKRYSNSTLEVSQDGRRGALMLSISVYHPDILDFISAKNDTGEINGANISVRVDEEFFIAVRNDEYITLKFPLEGIPRYLENIKARKIFNALAESMHKSAEPGILFWDEITEIEKNLVSTNPCGEIPLQPFDSCILSHINLLSFVKKSEDGIGFSISEYKKYVELGIRMLDATVSAEIEKLENLIDILTKDKVSTKTEINMLTNILKNKIMYRRIGQGITGLADTLAFIGLPYDNSEETMKFIDIIMKIKATAEMETSELLYEENEQKELLKIPKEYVHKYNKKFQTSVKNLNNISLSTIAPVGTGSFILGVTSGIEPLFMFEHERKIKSSGKDTILKVLHAPYVRDKEIIKGGIPRTHYKEAHEVNPLHKLELQELFQKYTTQSISVTHNLPKGTSLHTVKDMIIEASERKIKGFTIYIDGTREGVLNKTFNEDSSPRPPILKGRIFLHDIEGDIINHIVGLNEAGNPFEIFTLQREGFYIPEGDCKIIKNEDKTYTVKNEYLTVNINALYADSSNELLTRNVSKRMRKESVDNILKDFNKCIVPFGSKDHAMYRTLKYFAKDIKEKCSKCGTALINIEGCLKCLKCGNSKC